MPPFLFISYSRVELPYAESIALALLEKAQPVWFDLIGLAPGFDWQLQIEKGLQEAGGVILIASPNALKSPNVADEIRRAIAAAKPLFIVIVEATPLVLEHASNLNLAAAAHSIIDMRGDFQPAFLRLLGAIRTGTPVRDPVPVTHLVPTRFPRHVAELLLASFLLLATELWLLATWWQAPGFPWTKPAGSLNFAALSAMVLWHAISTTLFLRRRVTRETFGQYWGAQWLGVVYAVFWQRLHVPGLSANVFALLLVSIATGFSIYRLFWSVDLLRWKRSESPWRGPARARQLRTIGESVWKKQKEAKQLLDPRPYVYSLIHSPLDDKMAAAFRKALNGCLNVFERQPGKPLPQHPFPPVEWQLLLVTNQLTTEDWEAFDQLPGPAKLYLLATPAVIPPGAATQSRKLQWVDLRAPGLYQLSFLFMYLRGNQQARLTFASNYIPVRTESLIGPNGLAASAQAVNVLATWSLACGILAIFAPATTNPVSTLLPFAVAISVWQFWMVHNLYQRTRTLLQWVCELIASLVCCQFIGEGRLILKTVPVGDSFSAGVPFLFDKQYLWAIALLALALVVLGIQQLAQRWFPGKGSWKAPLASPSQWSIFRSQALFILFAVSAAFFMFVNRT